MPSRIFGRRAQFDPEASLPVPSVAWNPDGSSFCIVMLDRTIHKDKDLKWKVVEYNATGSKAKLAIEFPVLYKGAHIAPDGIQWSPHGVLFQVDHQIWIVRNGKVLKKYAFPKIKAPGREFFLVSTHLSDGSLLLAALVKNALSPGVVSTTMLYGYDPKRNRLTFITNTVASVIYYRSASNELFFAINVDSSRGVRLVALSLVTKKIRPIADLRAWEDNFAVDPPAISSDGKECLVTDQDPHSITPVPVIGELHMATGKIAILKTQDGRELIGHRPKWLDWRRVIFIGPIPDAKPAIHCEQYATCKNVRFESECVWTYDTKTRAARPLWPMKAQ